MTTPTPEPEVSATTIEIAEAQIRSIAGWHIWPATEETLTADNRDETLIHDGSNLIAFLPTKKLTAIAAVRIDGEEVNLDDVHFQENGTVEIGGGWRRWRSAHRLEADVTHGYEKQPVELGGIATAMAVRAASPHGAMRVGGISLGGTTAPSPQGAEWRTLDAYKLGPMP